MSVKSLGGGGKRARSVAASEKRRPTTDGGPSEVCGRFKRARRKAAVPAMPTPKRVTFSDKVVVWEYPPAPSERPARSAVSQASLQKLLTDASERTKGIALLGRTSARVEALWALLMDVTADVLASAGRRGAPLSEWSVVVRKTVLISLTYNTGSLALAADDGNARGVAAGLQRIAADMAVPAMLGEYWQPEILKIAAVNILASCQLLHARQFDQAADQACDVLDSLCEGGPPSCDFGEALQAVIQQWHELDGDLDGLSRRFEPLISEVVDQIHRLGPEPRH
jgi:hypothetical protein